MGQLVVVWTRWKGQIVKTSSRTIYKGQKRCRVWTTTAAAARERERKKRRETSNLKRATKKKKKKPEVLSLCLVC